MTNILETKRQAVASIKRDIADAQAVIQTADATTRVAQANAANLRTALANSGYYEKLAAAEFAESTATESEGFERLDRVAAEALKLDREDPRANRAKVTELVRLLRIVVPCEHSQVVLATWPKGQQRHLTLVLRVLALRPLDPMEVPGNVLRGEGPGFPTRIRAFLDATAEFNSPLETEAA